MTTLGPATPPINMGTYQDWLVAWKEWARTRKRGKMAQFIVDKLEDNKQARWLSIAEGKFELTEWHDIAKEWFKEKPRNSDQVDAPCMLRKGLPRAFPGLEEVKAESVKEGTQYRSRVFVAPPDLVREVMMYIQNGRLPGQMGMHVPPSYPPSTSLYNTYHQMTPYSSPMTTNSHSVHSPPQVHQVNGVGPSTQMYYNTPENPPIKLERSDNFIVNSPSSQGDIQSPYYGVPPYTQASGPLTDPLADMQMPNHHSPGSIYSEGHEGASPFAQQLQLPGAAIGQTNMPQEGGWISPNSHSTTNSPRYSPDPTTESATGYPVTTMGIPIPQTAPSAGVPVPSPPIQNPHSNLKVVPDSSPLEGGGQMVLVFYNELPPGNKFVTFYSRKRNNSITVDTTQENAMVLYALIPRHDIPETVLLQVYCEGRVLAQSEFTYYANSQFNSDQLFHYLVQNMPQYFNMDDISGAMGGGDMGMGGGASGGAYGYYGNIPASTYGLLLGACRLGLEPLVYHTLQVKTMSRISGEQLQKAYSCSVEHGHHNLANCLKHLVRFASFVARDPSVDVDSNPILGEGSKQFLEKLNTGGPNIEETSHMLLKRMAEKVAEEANSLPTQFPSPPPSHSHSPSTSPVHHSPSSTITPSLVSVPQQARRVSTTTKLRKQDSVKDPDEDVGSDDTDATPTGDMGLLGTNAGEREKIPHGTTTLHSAASVDSELKDSLQPLPRDRQSLRKSRLFPTQSDDNDSAVSMSFDRTFEDHDLQREIDRRMSGTFASSGLFSLSMSGTDKAADVTIDPAASYGFAHSLQYEGVFLVTEDYPPGEETIFRTGDRILAVGDTSVRGMGPDDFQELLEKETGTGNSTKVKVLPRMERSPPPPSSLSLGSVSSSLEMSEKKLLRRQSEKQMLDSITLKVSNLLSMKASGKPRTVTITSSADGFGFKVIGGNAVGLFVSEVKPVRKELCQGDQILEINGQDARRMTHYEATQLLRGCGGKVHLKVMDNGAKFTTIRDQFEFDSFFMRVLGEHKDISLRPNTVIRVVNTFLYSGHFWLAWIVDDNGTDCELRKIPSPSKAKQQYGKDVYEEIKQPFMVDRLSQPTTA